MSMRGLGSVIDIHLPGGYRDNDGAPPVGTSITMSAQARVPGRPVRAERDAAVGKGPVLGKATVT